MTPIHISDYSTVTGQACECGVKDSRASKVDSWVIGGVEAGVNDWPWMVKLKFSVATATQEVQMSVRSSV